MKNKIGWCDMTWNPCWGCNNNCPYCYARIFAKRFGERQAFWEMKYKYKNYFMGNNIDEYYEIKFDLQDFKLTFLERQFNKKFPKKPQRIFVGSMSEIKYWEMEWIQKVLDKVKQYPQHTFQFLTKFPHVYSSWYFPDNCWLGVTVTKNEYIYAIDKRRSKVRFLSIEPILEEIDIGTIDDFEPDWIIVGAETGNRKGKVIPKKEWIGVIIDFCNRTNRPLYIKNSIVEYYPEYGNTKEFPKEVGL